MGAGGSIVQINDDVELKVDPAKNLTIENLGIQVTVCTKGQKSSNLKSKFPSISSPSKQDHKQKEKPIALPVFKVEIPAKIPCLRILKVSRVYNLRISMESLDLVREGRTGPDSLIIQFPYQNISSWGSSPTAFQFTVFNISNVQTHGQSQTAVGGNSTDTRKENRKDEEKEILKETDEITEDMENVPVVTADEVSIYSYPEMKQHENDMSSNTITSQTSLLQSQQSSHADSKNVHNDESQQNEKEEQEGRDDQGGGGEDREVVGIEVEGIDVVITLKTNQAVLIEQATMVAVQRLMFNMEKSAVSKLDFEHLLEDIVDPDTEGLRYNWEEILSKYSETRAFLAKQAMDLLVLVGPFSPFEKYDLACLLYTKILNKESFQLVINTFEDVRDRENLIHRLKLDKGTNAAKHGEIALVSNCSVINLNKKITQ